LEIVRIFLVSVTFLGQLLLLDIALQLQVVFLAVHLPGIFGWCLTGQFGKELKNHRDDLIKVRDMFPIPPSISFSHWQRQHQNSFRINSTNERRNENQDTADAMMYSAPSLAYCIDNLS
jgi:hypothetical protein